MDNTTKQEYIGSIREELLQFQEISKIIIFGSFFESKNPHDIDVAIVQESDNNFLTLSLKYRKALRKLSKKIPIDIVPLKNNFTGFFAQEIEKGKIIYEK